MLALRHLPSRCSRPIVTLPYWGQLRQLHKPTSRSYQKYDASPPQPRKRSLFEELFPEELERSNLSSVAENAEDPSVPRLRTSDIEDEDWARDIRSKEVTEPDASETPRLHGPAVLVLRSASTSLVEADFRRIAPKGQHIEDWTGPGDILKVIPVRKPDTLEQRALYLILFPNAAYARIYQNHVVRLHRTAQKYTPTSLESPLPVQPGVMVEGEDVHALLQDYALCPPSQQLHLILHFTPYPQSVRRLLEQGGYPQITQNKGKDRTGRSVLFAVDGRSPPTGDMMQEFLRADAQARNMPWNVVVEKVEPSLLPNKDEMDPPEDVADGGEEESEEKQERRPEGRWMLSFGDESEARRFIRAWHRRRFPLAKGKESVVIQAEFLW